ncbi:MAG TPA: hypothetical protein VFD17_07200 [Clostridia bacterium]|nr:hypothetical protein [Clostridia bacterium]
MSLEKEFEQLFKDADLNEAEIEYFKEDIENAVQANLEKASDYYANKKTQFCLVHYALEAYKETAKSGLAKILGILPKDEKLEILKNLIGCRIDTHYNTGGIVTDVNGPFHDGYYTLFYAHDRDGSRCWINSIKVDDDLVTCEGVPLKISGQSKPRQLDILNALLI